MHHTPLVFRRQMLMSLCLFAATPVFANAVTTSVDKEPWLKERLEWFQDLKFGFMMHWGIWSEWGSIESWPLVEKDTWARPDDLKAWTERGKDLGRFQRDYLELRKTFNLTDKDGDGLPAQVSFSALKPKPGSKVKLLGVRKPLDWQTGVDGKTTLEIPASVRQAPPCQHAFAFQFQIMAY